MYNLQSPLASLYTYAIRNSKRIQFDSAKFNIISVLDKVY